MGIYIKKLIVAVITFPNYIYNQVVLKYRKVNVGTDLKVSGRIYVVSNSKNSISIGDHVRINSCRKANPIGGDTKTILFAKGNGTIKIGSNCGISNSTIFACESVTIGNNVLIGGNVKIYDTDFHWIDYNKRKSALGGKIKPVVIGNNVFIGAHSIILKGVTIGDRSVVGAGSIVTKDIPTGEMWAGNPARYIRSL